jgi:hypothetical protein
MLFSLDTLFGLGLYLLTDAGHLTLLLHAFNLECHLSHVHVVFALQLVARSRRRPSTLTSTHLASIRGRRLVPPHQRILPLQLLQHCHLLVLVLVRVLSVGGVLWHLHLQLLLLLQHLLLHLLLLLLHLVAVLLLLLVHGRLHLPKLSLKLFHVCHDG